MKDNFGRDINYMRISITDRCNLRCKYCMPDKDCIVKLAHEQMLSFEEIERVVRAAAELGITKFRLTGGEPLVRKDITNLISQLSKIPGVEELALTTNGVLLADMAKELKAAGLTRVNISLDTTDPERYREITRVGNIENVLKGIKAAEEENLTPIKINIVALGGFNDDEFEKFAKWTIDKPIDVRFIELMPIGHADVGTNYGYVSNEEVRNHIPGLVPVECERYTVSDNYMYPGAKGKVGFISALSNHFCAECNRIRLTSDGRIKPCLHSNEEIDIREVLRKDDDIKLKDTLAEAIRHKPVSHHLNEGAAPIERDMNRIGG